MFFTSIALPCSFVALPQGRYGLQLNWVSQQIQDTPFVDPGMYYTGFGNQIIEYPSTYQMMYFMDTNWQPDNGEILRAPLKCRTIDGLEMTVALSLQWRIESSAMTPMYRILGNLETGGMNFAFVRLATGVVFEGCSYFKAEAFFENREAIANKWIAMLSSKFRLDTDGYLATSTSQAAAGEGEFQMVSIIGLQLREVEFVGEYAAELSTTQREMQDNEVAVAERDRERVVKQIDMVTKVKLVEEQYILATAQAEKTKIDNTAVVNQIKVFAQKQALANAEVVKVLKEDSAPYERLFDMMEVRALERHNAGSLTVTLK